MGGQGEKATIRGWHPIRLADSYAAYQNGADADVP